MAVILVTYFNLICNHVSRLVDGAQPPALFRRASVAGQHGLALPAVKAESGMERSCSPSGELHSTEHQQHRESVHYAINFTSSPAAHVIYKLNN